MVIGFLDLEIQVNITQYYTIFAEVHKKGIIHE